MAVALVAMMLSSRQPGAGLLAFVAMVAVPALSWRQLTKSWLADQRCSRVGDLWTQGVTAFACGSVIMGLAAWIFLAKIQPGYISGLVEQAAALYHQMGDAQSLRWERSLRQVADRGLLPSPIMLAIQMMMLATFAGSVWSLLVAVGLRLRTRAIYKDKQ